MANLSMGDRNAMERAAAGDESILRGRDGSRRGQTIYLVIAMVILAALSFAAFQAIHGWDHIIIIADLVIFTGAVAAFVYRKPTNEL